MMRRHRRRRACAISSGSSTVHTLTRSPTACAASMPAGAARERRRAIGVQPRVTVLGRDARRPPRDLLAAASATPVVDVGRDRAARVDRAEIERRDDHVGRPACAPHERRRPRARPRRRRVGVGLPRQTLDLDVHDHPRARVERLGERRDLGPRRARSAANGVLDDQPEAARPAGSWCTTSTPSAVRRTSSSTPSAPSSRARANAASVFSGPAARRAPVAEHERTVGHRARWQPTGAPTFRKHVPLRDAKRPGQTPCRAQRSAR